MLPFNISLYFFNMGHEPISSPTIIGAKEMESKETIEGGAGVPIFGHSIPRALPYKLAINPSVGEFDLTLNQNLWFNNPHKLRTV